jgi:hypothetical protein
LIKNCKKYIIKGEENMLKSIWSFLKGIFGGTELNNNITKVKNKGDNNIIITGDDNVVNSKKNGNEKEKNGNEN